MPIFAAATFLCFRVRYVVQSGTDRPPPLDERRIFMVSWKFGRLYFRPLSHRLDIHFVVHQRRAAQYFAGALEGQFIYTVHRHFCFYHMQRLNCFA